MKRINLKSISNSLSNQEMKLVAGGSDPNNPMNPVDPEGGGGGGGATCGWRGDDGYGQCGVTKAEAMFMAVGIPGRYWCCESCASNGGGATYC